MKTGDSQLHQTFQTQKMVCSTLHPHEIFFHETPDISIHIPHEFWFVRSPRELPKNEMVSDMS